MTIRLPHILLVLPITVFISTIALISTHIKNEQYLYHLIYTEQRDYTNIGRNDEIKLGFFVGLQKELRCRLFPNNKIVTHLYSCWVKLIVLRMHSIVSSFREILFIFLIAILDGFYAWSTRRIKHHPDHSYLYHRLKLTTKLYMSSTLLLYLLIPTKISFPDTLFIIVTVGALLLRQTILFFRVN